MIHGCDNGVGGPGSCTRSGWRAQVIVQPLRQDCDLNCDASFPAGELEHQVHLLAGLQLVLGPVQVGRGGQLLGQSSLPALSHLALPVDFVEGLDVLVDGGDDGSKCVR